MFFPILVLLLLVPLTRSHNCPVYTTRIITHAASTPRSLLPHTTEFLSTLGVRNTGTSTRSGHRHLDWDDESPFSTTGNFTPSGLLLHTRSSKFLHSNAPDTDDDRFSSTIRRSLSRTFRRFSLPRIIIPAKSNKLRARFVIPGTAAPAGVAAFGVVFVDVDEPRRTWIWLKDAHGCTVARVEASVLDGGMSFVGVVVGDARRPVVQEVMVKLGSASIAEFRRDDPPKDALGDLVAMDDVFFAEPKDVDEPGGTHR